MILICRNTSTHWARGEVRLTLGQTYHAQLVLGPKGHTLALVFDDGKRWFCYDADMFMPAEQARKNQPPQGGQEL